MRTRLLIALLLLLPATLYSQTQTYATITSSGIKDEGGNLLQSGTLCFLPVSQSTGLPMNYTVIGDGQRSTAPVCSPVAAGVVTPFPLTNSQITWPANACYRVTVTDADGTPIIGSSSSTAKSGMGCVQMNPSWCSMVGGTYTCNFDNYPINQAPQITMVSPTLSGGAFSTGPAGSAVSCTVTGNSPTYQLNCEIPQGHDGATQITGLSGDGAGNATLTGKFSASTVVAGTIASQTSLTLFGNSISHGEGVYLPQQAIPALLQRMHGGGLKNYAFESNQIADDASLAYSVTKSVSQQTLAEPLYAIAEGTNDAQVCGTSVGCETNFSNEYLATAAYLLLPRASMVYGQDAACTPSGTWYADNVLQAGMGEASYTASSTLTCTITTAGNPLIETWAASPGNGGTATISIDGGSATALLGYGSSGQTVQTSHLVSEVPTAQLFSVGAGSHTVVVTVTSSSTQLTTSSWTAAGSGTPEFTVTNPGYARGQQVMLSGCTTNTGWNNLPATIATYPAPTTSLFGVLLPGVSNVTGSGTDTCVINTNPFTQLWMGSAGAGSAAVSNTLLMAGVWYQHGNSSAAATAAYDVLVSSLATTLQGSGFPSPHTSFIPIRTYVNYTTDMASGVAQCSGIGSGGEHPNCQGAAHTAQAFQTTRPDLFNAYVGASGDTTIPPNLNQSSTNISGMAGFSNFATSGPFQSTAWNGGITWGWNGGGGYVSGATTTTPLQPYSGVVASNVFFMPGGWEFCFSTLTTGLSSIANSSNQNAIVNCAIWGMPGNGQFHAQHLYADTDLYVGGVAFNPSNFSAPLVVTSTTIPQITAAYDSTHKFGLQADSNGNGYLVAPTSGSSILLYPANTKIMQITKSGFYESATGTAISGTNYASPEFVTTASAYLSSVATNVQHREFLLFDTMTSTPTYSNYELVNQSVTMPMITSLVGSAGHYFDLNPQASTDYVINHTSDMFWLTDKGRPGFYDGTTVEQLIAIPATASPATKTCTTYPTVVNGVVTSC